MRGIFAFFSRGCIYTNSTYDVQKNSFDYFIMTKSKMKESDYIQYVIHIYYYNKSIG